MKAYIYTFGLEKTFNNGMGSIGIRLPLDNLTANSSCNVVNTPTSTSLGNLTRWDVDCKLRHRTRGRPASREPPLSGRPANSRQNGRARTSE